MSRPDTAASAGREYNSGSADLAARDELFDMINGYWCTQMLCAAAELGLVDELAGGPCDATTLAERTGADAGELVRLMRALVGFGILARTEDGRYTATATGRLLERDRDGSMHARALLIRRLWYPAWSELHHSVRTGETALDHVFGASLFEHLATDRDTAAIFDATMADSTRVAADEVADIYDAGWARTIVDVGGGTGALLIGLLQRNPGANGVLVDTPDVAARARDNVFASPVRDRCEIREGDFFAEVPSGADLYLLSWILHDWRDEPAARILTTCRRAMAESSRLLIIEAVLPEQPEPTVSSLYDLHMMAVAGGRERTEREYDELVAEAGLERTATYPTRGVRAVLETRRPRGPSPG